MSERTISIAPYLKADNLIGIGGYVKFEGVEDIINLPERNVLVLQNYSLSNGDKLIPRNHNFIKIYLKPSFLKGHSIHDFTHLILKDETIESVLKLRIQIFCRNTRWCSNQISLKLSEIDGRTEINFNIPLIDIKEEIIISSQVTREKGSNSFERRKANAILSVLSECEEIIIQVDEKREIGSNHLPIDFENLKDVIFEISGLEGDFDLPRIKVSEEFREYFVRDNINIVNNTFMMSMFYILDSFLKWLIFKCKYDLHDKNHKGLIELFSGYCEVSKASLVELVEGKKYDELQVKEYLILSTKLLRGIQVNPTLKYVKELKQMIKEELK